MSHPSPPFESATLGPPHPTPSYGPGGSFSVRCSARIAASPRECLDVILDTSDYSWNRFCRKCTIDSQPSDAVHPYKLQVGTQFTFDIHMHPDGPDGTTGRPTPLEVSVLEPIDEEIQGSRRKGWRIAWRQRPTALMLRAERVQEFVEVNGGAETEYRCWETFYGVLAPVVRLAVGKQLEKGFDAWTVGLKQRVERRARRVWE